MDFKISSFDKGGLFSRAVPLIGLRILIGIDFIPKDLKSKAISILSSMVSPNPSIPPLHTSKPAF